ncbi:DUF6010 family protein [Zobellia galactanivorans]|uniref:DUF6010 family protein n=1 Tax=Zobellia galactanivorans (strain DSM 12802 / CCUG 47099 / CIP 106680 / NCIMB 13871 / Dsij) TaxID=63186 RepID=UPI001C066A25|nr:DUF6010 family protein [Zobellia galactanivorans]MBU3026082.1 hypothetical protein [Zobellia galactanivorans]
MEVIALGIATALVIIAAIECSKLNLRAMGALILTGIAFIYVGFVPTEFPEILFESLHAIAFLLIAYFGLTKDKNLIWIGLVFHSFWDAGHLYHQVGYLPDGYEVFCIEVDLILAIYFYLRMKK